MPTVTPAVRSCIETLLADPGVQKALAFLEADQANMVAELKEMTVLHGAPFAESELRSHVQEKIGRPGRHAMH